jgi:hypothetical protein
MCAGDGQSGYRVQMVYTYLRGQANRFSQLTADFQRSAEIVDSYFLHDSAGRQRVRWVCSGGKLSVRTLEVPGSGLADFANAQSRVENRSDRIYTAIADYVTGNSGIGYIAGDDRPTQDNVNNTGPNYSITYPGYWGWITAHELGHNMGAVQRSAPYSTAGWHCADDYARMCYDDRTEGSQPRVVNCPDAQAPIFDCRGDNYYALVPTGYLATHWNLRDSRFLTPL